MKYKNILIPLISALFFLNTYASSDQPKGYKIEVNAPFKEGSVAYLANYWEGATYITDSIVIPKGGIFTFANAERDLTAGQYLLYIQPDIQIDFLLDNGQNNIQIEVNQDNFADSKIKGSRDSQVFWQYLKELNILHADIQNDVTKLNESEIGSKEHKLAEEHYITALRKIENLSDKYIKENEGSWFSTFIKSSSPIQELHPVPKSREQNIENAKYLREHYFDNIDLLDIRMWRTNFFAPQVKDYLFKMIPQHPDTIAQEASWIVSKTVGNEDAYQKMLSYLVNDATTSHNMGMENVWAKLAEDYIFDKKLNWIDSTQYSNLRAEYALIEQNRIGMKGQNLKLRTIDGDSISTNDIDAEFLLIYFYAPSCGYCRTEMPKMRNDFYEKYKELGLKVVAINIDQDIESWKSFIEQNNMGEWYNGFDPDFKSDYWLKYNTSGTPSLYLLDKNKTILAKKLDITNLEKYLEMVLQYK